MRLVTESLTGGEPSEELDLLTKAVVDGSETDLQAWARTGPRGVLVLRGVLDGTIEPKWSGTHPRDRMDGPSEAVARLASRDRAFLETFAGNAFANNTFVLTGLGQIDDAEATDRLARAARATDQFVRMRAAIGLRRRTSAVAEAALMGLIADPEFVVRYHALESLAAIGTEMALPALERFVGTSPLESELAERAIAAITRRRGATDP
jgi:hypothetical protein